MPNFAGATINKPPYIMKQKTLLTFLLFFCSMCIWAKVGPGVQLYFVSGEKITVLLEEEPLFTFENDDVVITTTKRVLRCASGELLKFTHVNLDKSGIDDVEADDTRVYFTDDGVSASNLKPRSEFAVYTQDGRLICSAQADDQGNVKAQFPMQEGVVYIIKTSAATFKMMKP